jgi:hypothetical protein
MRYGTPSTMLESRCDFGDSAQLYLQQTTYPHVSRTRCSDLTCGPLPRRGTKQLNTRTRSTARRTTLAGTPGSRPVQEEQHPLMTEPQRTALITSAINVARMAFAGAIIGGCAVGLAAQAYADSGSGCDPFYLSMTPQPVLSCPGPDAAPPPDGSAVPGPVNDVAGPPPPGAPPPPG